MKTYQAATFGNVSIVDERGGRTTLPPRFDLARHSPTGFSWGGAGSGPAQLALAILADALDDEMALAFYQRFKNRAIATVSREGPFCMTTDEVSAHMAALEEENVNAT